MPSPMIARLLLTCRSAQDDFSDTCRNVIGAIFTTVMTRAVVCVVQDSSMIAVAGSKPKDNGWKTSEVQRQEAAVTVVTTKVMLRME